MIVIPFICILIGLVFLYRHIWLRFPLGVALGLHLAVIIFYYSGVPAWIVAHGGVFK